MREFSFRALYVVVALCASSRIAFGSPDAGPAVHPRHLAFMQDGLHNCGTMAMLISWADMRPQDADNLVRRQPNGNYVVSFKVPKPVIVSSKELAAATKARVVRADKGDEWARIVLTAFVKVKSKRGKLDFRSTDWIHAGEILTCLTGRRTWYFGIKQEKPGRNGRLEVGPRISLFALNKQLAAIRGKPCTAYTNLRVHIWALLDYDARKSRVLVRNPRRAEPEWMPVPEFARRFQLLVYG